MVIWDYIVSIKGLYDLTALFTKRSHRTIIGATNRTMASGTSFRIIHFIPSES